MLSLRSILYGEELLDFCREATKVVDSNEKSSREAFANIDQSLSLSEPEIEERLRKVCEQSLERFMSKRGALGFQDVWSRGSWTSHPDFDSIRLISQHIPRCA